MRYNPELHHRRSIRLKNFDYSKPGAYFITICTKNRERLFGDVVDGKMVLNDGGKAAERCWMEIPLHYPNVVPDEFVIMPDHVHGIIVINEQSPNHGEQLVSAVVQHFEPLPKNLQPKQNKYQKIIPRSIGSMIRGYKIGVTKWFRQNTDIFIVWQRNYHEQIIHTKTELQKIRNYIIENPLKWKNDEH